MRTRSARAVPLALAALLAGPALASAPGEEAASSYRIDTSASTAEVAAGAEGKVVLAIVPEPGIHVHPQAPLRITLTSAGLALAKGSLGHGDAVDPKADGPRFEVAFTANAAGATEVKAKLDFFVCSDRWCVKQVRELSIPVVVIAAGVGPRRALLDGAGGAEPPGNR